MLPVWLMRGKVIVGISSPAGRNSFFSKLFYATIPSTNRRVFNGYIYEGFCEDCKEKNKMETCSHEPWKYPPWLHISEKMESIRAALGDDMETFNKEQKGLLDDVEKNVYVDPKLVEAMKKRTLFDWTGLEPPKFLVIAADPNQGGECDTAISALCPYNGTTIVLGLESYPCFTTKDIKVLFARFISELYDHPWLKSTTFVLFVERNTAAGAEALEAIMTQYKRAYIIMDQDGEHAGWWTTWAHKAAYCISGAEQMRENKIYFLKDAVATNPWVKKEERWKYSYDKLIEQLPRFKARTPDPTTGRKRRLPIISGTINSEGKKVKGFKDDVGLSFFMALFFADNISKEKIPGLNYNRIKGRGLY